MQVSTVLFLSSLWMRPGPHTLCRHFRATSATLLVKQCHRSFMDAIFLVRPFQGVSQHQYPQQMIPHCQLSTATISIVLSFPRLLSTLTLRPRRQELGQNHVDAGDRRHWIRCRREGHGKPALPSPIDLGLSQTISEHLGCRGRCLRCCRGM